MSRTYRSLVGTILMVAFVLLYAMIVMLFSPLILKAASDALPDLVFKVVEAIYYLFAGLGWTLPLLPLIKWMNRPDAAKDLPKAAPLTSR